MRAVALGVFVTGMFSLTAVCCGILSCTIVGDQRGKTNAGIEFVIVLAVPALSFVVSLTYLCLKRFATADRRYLVIFACFLLFLTGSTVFLLRG